MKKIFLLFAVFAIVTVQKSFAQESAKQNQFSSILNSYYSIKNALVSSDASSAAVSAKEFLTALDGLDMKTMSDSDHKAFMALQEKLSKDAKTIENSKNIETQRTAFSSLSDNVYSLAKDVKLSSDPIYQQYCPMKKSSWLSNEAAIKNPYYGKSMPTCGKVTNTLK
ncbi:MAG: DUF3347 domain-containing protein [Ferruginibacter sp.]